MKLLKSIATKNKIPEKIMPGTLPGINLKQHINNLNFYHLLLALNFKPNRNNHRPTIG